MQLFADRFVIDDDGVAVDLATGRRVEIRRVDDTGGTDRGEQLRWSVRCDRWFRLHHRAIACMVDYGVAPRGVRFEAWDCGPPWNGSDDEGARVRDLARRFLEAASMTSIGSVAAHVRRGRAVVVPGEDDGYDRPGGGVVAGPAPLAVRGQTRIPRQAVTALAEMFESVGAASPSMASLWGEPGAGRRTVVAELARAARLKGFIPIASRLLGAGFASLWEGRALFVVHDDREGAAGPWPNFLHSTLRTPLAHVLLIVGDRESPHTSGVGLGPVAADDLIASIHPAVLNARLANVVRRAAHASRGRPGLFARLLWRDWSDDSAAARRGAAVRAAERAADYGGEYAEASAPAGGAQTPPVDAWPLPGELAAERKRITAAREQLARGGHSFAFRLLRQASSALARRDAWSDAASAALLLAGALRARGRARDALAVLDEARPWTERSCDEAMLLDMALLAGEARVDLVRFDEAEAVLTAAAASASSAGDSARTASTAIAIARCRFWRGQYLDAATALERCDAGASAVLQTRRSLELARIRVGCGDAAGAIGIVTVLQQDPAAGADPGLRSAVWRRAALAHLAVGDLDAVRRDVRESAESGRAAHAPLSVLRARLLLAEADRRSGRLGHAARFIERLRRLRQSLPPLLRAQIDLLLALTETEAPDARVTARLVSTSGVPALALHAPRESRRGTVDPVVDDLLVILRACQTAEDETVVLKDVCAHVRRQLHAIGAAFVARSTGPRGCDPVVAEGSRVEPHIAERAMTASIVIRPHRHDDRVEGAAPVMYGGSAIGALSARWSLGSAYDADRAANVLATAATAAAPLLAAALAHRARTAPPDGAGVASLLGVTPAMVELRRIAQRAGAAPFGVLIVGESGSGKELVARAIHRSSQRRDRPFVTLNCAALPEDLVESELFGHARGAFTGAAIDRSGVFEEAHAGTLFLDEIGELSPRAQAKILRVVQEGELRRIGENVARRIDVRLVAATNRDLAAEVDAGRFRLDLLYRLDVIRIAVPPLRDRPDDVAVLAAQFWSDATARLNSRATLAASTLAALARYHWPGNVRELQNVLSALAVRSPRRGLVPPSALPPQFGTASRDEHCRLDDARRTFEERFVRAALVRTGGHRTRAAAELGVSRQGLTKLLARLGIADGPRSVET